MLLVVAGVYVDTNTGKHLCRSFCRFLCGYLYRSGCQRYPEPVSQGYERENSGMVLGDSKQTSVHPNIDWGRRMYLILKGRSDHTSQDLHVPCERRSVQFRDGLVWFQLVVVWCVKIEMICSKRYSPPPKQSKTQINK